MIDVSEKERLLIHEILNKFVPNVPVFVFGSRVKGSAKSYSDLDLVIIDNDQIATNLYYQLQDAFEESPLPYRVDILDWHRISREFQAIIKQSYEPLC